MFGSSVMEVGIGLFGVYAMMSLICTAGNELIASITTWRATTLADGIRNLLNDHATADTGGTSGGKTSIAPGTLAQQFYDHPLIQSLYRKGQNPSYIPSRTFALALMDLVVPAGPGRPDTLEGIRKAVQASSVPDGLKRVLAVLIDDARNTAESGRQLQSVGVVDPQKIETAINHVHENVEVWFNNSMERVAGWYKRKTQALTVALAVAITVALNVDTVQIVRRLSYDTALRQALVARAEQLAAQPVESGGQPPADPLQRTKEAAAQFDKQVEMLRSTALPIGWGSEADSKDRRDAWWYLTKLFGLLLTAGAASLGAPFWFDVLNKIVTIRSSGKAPEEAPKSPREVPRPLAPGQPSSPPPVIEQPASGGQVKPVTNTDAEGGR